MPVNKNDLSWQATVKAYPAVADLQAIRSFVRAFTTELNVGAPNYSHDIYSVPGNRIFVLQLLMAYCAQPDPTAIDFVLRLGGVDYPFYSALYGAAWEQHLWNNPIMYNETETVRVTWSGTLATTDVTALLFGYLIEKY